MNIHGTVRVMVPVLIIKAIYLMDRRRRGCENLGGNNETI